MPHAILTAQQRLAVFMVVLVAVTLAVLTDLKSDQIDGRYVETAETLRRQLSVLDKKKTKPAPEAFAFDPNTVTKEELLRLGLTERRAASWLKFRGARATAFRSPEDIRRLYVLDDATKDRLVQLAFVADAPHGGPGKTDRYTNAPIEIERFRFDPNAIATEDLRRLGLGYRQARAYVSYRAKIDGGFSYAGQLRRLPFLDDELQIKLATLADFPEPPPPTLAASFSFDPNTVSLDSLQLLGFPKYQAEGLLRYRGDRRVTFRKPSDLRRVRSLDSTLVELVLPLISIAPFPPSTAPAAAPSTYGGYTPPPALKSIDLNTADTTLLQTIPGIGSYRARRIVRYREALGGFYDLDQLRKTRGLPDSISKRAVEYLKVGDITRRIKINLANFEELNRHPNINRKQASAVVRYRDKHGHFAGADDVRRIRLFNDQDLVGILPYLSYITQ